MAKYPTPTASDIGRVYTHGTSVRVVLLNHQGDEPYQVTVKCVEPTQDGEYLVTQVDARHLAPTDERIGVPTVSLTLTAEEAALISALIAEAVWSYEQSGEPEVAQMCQDLQETIHLARHAVDACAVLPKLYDRMFAKTVVGEGV